MTRKLITSIIAALALAAHGGIAVAGCTLQKVLELPVTVENLRPLVPVKINGADIKLFIDTGAFFSSLDPATAAKLGLHLDPLPANFEVRGFTGRVDAHVARAKQVEFGGYTLRGGADFLVDEHALGEGDGILGQNLLGGVDVEYDFANGVVRLFQPSGCGDASLAYWVHGGTFAELNIDPVQPPSNEISGNATLNGTRIRVIFDTGSPRSVLSLRAARRAGVKTDGPDVIRAGVIGGGGRDVIASWLAPFQSLEIGGEQVKATRLRVADFDPVFGADMFIGADFFLSHRIYVAKSQRRLYFTYNGGPVFNLEQPSSSPAQAAAVTSATSDEPKDAAGFNRRAAGYVSRREYDLAIADYTSAIALSPDDPKNFVDRGVARAFNRQPILAMDDFDQALKLKPDDAPALMMRGRFRISEKDEAGARADFDAALKLDPNVRLQVAGAYSGAGLFEDALANYDRWIADHTKNEDLADALNGRCWARALWGRDLQQALADCEESLHLRPGMPQTLDSRGLVRLRMGDVDGAIADYDAVLKVAPKTAWSLYGRGIAEQRKGLKDQGAADIAAAAAINPLLPGLATSYGVAP
jgi:tetratricopeptide (TPR) repeat protein/predicted aspartyl protease